jgi:hypothetical protein
MQKFTSVSEVLAAFIVGAIIYLFILRRTFFEVCFACNCQLTIFEYGTVVCRSPGWTVQKTKHGMTVLLSRLSTAFCCLSLFLRHNFSDVRLFCAARPTWLLKWVRFNGSVKLPFLCVCMWHYSYIFKEAVDAPVSIAASMVTSWRVVSKLKFWSFCRIVKENLRSSRCCRLARGFIPF